jgi:hypothetical protein
MIRMRRPQFLKNLSVIAGCIGWFGPVLRTDIEEISEKTATGGGIEPMSGTSE